MKMKCKATKKFYFKGKVVNKNDILMLSESEFNSLLRAGFVKQEKSKR